MKEKSGPSCWTEVHNAIHWINDINLYLVDGAIQRLNNRGYCRCYQVDDVLHCYIKISIKNSLTFL